VGLAAESAAQGDDKPAAGTEGPRRGAGLAAGLAAALSALERLPVGARGHVVTWGSACARGGTAMWDGDGGG
jgi:hypothetical protein